MLVRLVDFLFAVAITLVLALILLSTRTFAADKAMEQLRQTAVRIEGVACSGSGSIIEGPSGRKYIGTNAHVCNCAGEKGYFYATREGGELIKAHIIKRSWAYDLCAGQVESSRPGLKLGHAPAPLSQVFSRGYPGGRLVETHGKIGGSSTWTWDADISMMDACPQGSRNLFARNGNVAGCALTFTSTLTNLYGRPGSSGSAVVNNNGELVGVLSSWMPDSEFSAGMVPYSQLREFLGDL